MWTCRRCGQDQEDQFDVCWSCLTPRDVRPGPDVGSADEGEEDLAIRQVTRRVRSMPRMPPGVKRYQEAYWTSRSIVSIGRAVQYVGTGAAILLVLVSIALFAGSGETELGVLVALAGLLACGFINILGIMISAAGQMQQALLDTAVHTSPFLTDEQRRTAMSLRR